MNKRLKSSCLLVILGLLLSFMVLPGAAAVAGVEIFDYGDAPEDDIAYPSTGQMGRFPTCEGGSAGVIWLWGWPGGSPYFGPAIDNDTDGNAGNCDFPPYDQDECFNDGDAGLLYPEPYTIDSTGVVVPCPGCTGGTLGLPCCTANWGVDLDISYWNYEDQYAFVNVLIDWNQDGQWGGSSICPGTGVVANEHVLVNHLIGWGAGNLSQTHPPSFRIGPNPGYVWARFVINVDGVPGDDWDGSLDSAEGEVEDYLLKITSPSAPSSPSPTTTGGPVGITPMPMDKSGLLLPWVVVAGLLVMGTGTWVFARRHLNR